MLQKDPAIEKFGWIRENTDKFFKFKPRSVRNAVIWCLLVPATVLYICKTQVTVPNTVSAAGHVYVLSITSPIIAKNQDIT